jgi:large subunit ribosomal protein L43
MSVRGTWQLRELVLQYCSHSGSSKGARHVIREHLVPWCEQNPQVQVAAALRSGRHPVLRAQYVNGRDTVIDVKNLLPKEIESHMWDLRNTTGKKIKAAKFDVISQKNSLQGPWTSELSKILQDQGRFKIEDYNPKNSSTNTITGTTATETKVVDQLAKGVFDNFTRY